MKALVSILFTVALASGSLAGTVVTNSADLTRLVYHEHKLDVAFDICGVTPVSKLVDRTICVYNIDGSGGAILYGGSLAKRISLRAGDRIRAKGYTRLYDYGQVAALCESIEIVGHGPVPEPEPVSIEELRSGRFDCHYVKIRGTLRDVFDDEIDGGFTYLVLSCDGTLLYAPAKRHKVSDDMIGAEVEISGICEPMSAGGRRYMGYTLRVADANAIKMLKASDEDPFAVPEIDETQNLGPTEIQALGKRRARGTVLATWRHNNIVIATARGRPIFATIANQQPPPIGSSVEIVGLPETDLFSLTLSRALWRPSKDAPVAPQELIDMNFNMLLGAPDGNRRLMPYYNGTTVRIKGDVVGLESDHGHIAVISISDGKRILTVDTSAIPGAADDLSVGCRIEVTGVCVLETDNWRPGSLFPPASGYRLVVRTPDELRILAYPPWWTTERLLIVIGILAAALAFLLLRAAVRHRFGTVIAKAEADARVRERTRLAVELHDSVAQNLTGVAMEIRSAKRAKEIDPSRTNRHLDLAAATLDSCRDELRNCIWDLRNLMLDDTTVAEAIRRTLKQHIADARLEVRFNADRRLFPDNMLYTILRIIRELTINAIRHRNADDIKVAGCIDGGRLLFSVRDNGCGFDPDSAPGMSEGHFGLQGIRERVDTLEGSFEMESISGKGTKASISIPLPRHKKEVARWRR